MATAAATTENGAPSLNTTGNARVNLFFKLTRDVCSNPRFLRWIDEAWAEDPLDTMKILFHGRDSRGGKGDRAPFIAAMTHICDKYYCWFYKNIGCVPEYGRYLDWFELYQAGITANIPIYRYGVLIDKIVEGLEADLANMNEGLPVTLLAKWIPSEGKKWNRGSNILLKVCQRLFNVEKIDQYHYRQLRVKYITPLRAYLNIVENYMCAGRWDEIQFSKVPSVAMNKLKKAFEKNVPLHFGTWRTALAEGRATVNAAQVDPHNLVSQYMNHGGRARRDAGVADEVIEAQWRELVAETAAKCGTALERTLVLSDVSGSMHGTPMEVSIALGILIAGLTSEPFRGAIVTFHEEPRFHFIPEKCATLKDKVDNIMNKMSWGGNTDLTKVFEVILARATQFKIPADAMPTRLIILSDMQFDLACGAPTQTQFEVIDQIYGEAGYRRPAIVFWNLRSDTTRDFPVTYNEHGVMLVSGYRTAILKTILNGRDGGADSALTAMRETIDAACYDLIAAP